MPKTRTDFCLPLPPPPHQLARPAPVDANATRALPTQHLLGRARRLAWRPEQKKPPNHTPPATRAATPSAARASAASPAAAPSPPAAAPPRAWPRRPRNSPPQGTPKRRGTQLDAALAHLLKSAKALTPTPLTRLTRLALATLALALLTLSLATALRASPARDALPAQRVPARVQTPERAEPPSLPPAPPPAASPPKSDQRASTRLDHSEPPRTPTEPRTTNTLERRAADALAEGRYDAAARLHAELAELHPDRPVHRQAARILAERAGLLTGNR